MDEIDQQIRALEGEASEFVARGNLGEVKFRNWQPFGDQMGGELLILMHGGSGSWTHWIRNIPALSNYYELLVPDLPSLGDSSTLKKDTTPAEIADLMAETITQTVGPRRFHFVAFSWGSVVAALSAPLFGNQLKSILLVGPASTGKPPRKSQMQALIPRSKEMSAQQIRDANYENLARLMIANRANIDALAVELQTRNTSKARYNSPKFALTELVLEGIANTEANLSVLYGAEDTVSRDYLDWREAQFRSIRPDVTFEVVPGVGHWLQYEAADWFNQRVVNWVEQNIFA